MVKSAYFSVESNCLTTRIGSSISGVNTVMPINLSESVTDSAVGDMTKADADLFGSFQYFYLIIGLNIQVLPRI